MAAKKSQLLANVKGTNEIIHPETEIDQISDLGATLIKTLLKAATTSAARQAIEAAAASHSHQFSDLSGVAAASHSHAVGDITNFASSVITAIGAETLAALGVRYSITTNGYICFGDLFGGLILQWTWISKSSTSWTTNRIDAKLPIAMNTEILASITSPGETGSFVSYHMRIDTTQTIRVYGYGITATANNSAYYYVLPGKVGFLLTCIGI